MYNRIIMAFLTWLLLGLAAPGHTSEIPMEPGKISSENFLRLLDEGEFQTAWWETDEILQATSPIAPWVYEIRRLRKLFGAVEKRELKTLVHKQSLPLFPDGDYLVLLYKTQFAHKQGALEMLKVRRNIYGEWRIVDYSLR